MGEKHAWKFALLQHFRYYNCLEVEGNNTDFYVNERGIIWKI
jgi:hypothetical protein